MDGSHDRRVGAAVLDGAGAVVGGRRGPHVQRGEGRGARHADQPGRGAADELQGPARQRPGRGGRPDPGGVAAAGGPDAVVALGRQQGPAQARPRQPGARRHGRGWHDEGFGEAHVHDIVAMGRKTSRWAKTPRLGRGTAADSCRIYGSLNLNRVQGDFHITARGHGYAEMFAEHLDHKGK